MSGHLGKYSRAARLMGVELSELSLYPDEPGDGEEERELRADGKGEDGDLAIDIVPESDPLSDRVLWALADDFHAEELQASSVD